MTATSFLCLVLLIVACFGASAREQTIENTSWFKLMLINNVDSSSVPVTVFGGLASFVIDSVYTKDPETFSYPTCTADNVPMDWISSDFKVACKECEGVAEPIIAMSIFSILSTFLLVLLTYGITYFDYFDTLYFRKVGLAISALTGLLLFICTILAGVHCIDPFQEALTEVPRAIQNPVLEKTHVSTSAGPGLVCEIVAVVLYVCVFMPTFYYSLSHEKLKAPMKEPILDQDYLIPGHEHPELSEAVEDDDVSVNSKTFRPNGRVTSAASFATTNTDVSFKSVV